MKHLKIYEDFKKPINKGYINAKIRELKDFTREVLEIEGSKIHYTLTDNMLNVNIDIEDPNTDKSKSLDIIIEFENLFYSVYSYNYDPKYNDNRQLTSIEEGMQLVQDVIYKVFNLSEKLILEDSELDIADQIIDDLLDVNENVDDDALKEEISDLIKDDTLN